MAALRASRRATQWAAMRAAAEAEARRHLPLHDADDVVQDVLAHLVPRLEDLRLRLRDWDAYVRVLVWNTCRRRHARRYRRPRPSSLDQLLGGGAQLASPAEPPPDASGTAGEVPDAVPRRVLVQLVLRLPSRERRVLVRHFLHDQAIARVARALCLQRGQVRRSVKRILGLARFPDRWCTPPPT